METVSDSGDDHLTSITIGEIRRAGSGTGPVLTLLTGFTHECRIAVVNQLVVQEMPAPLLAEKTGMSRYLKKLSARGFVLENAGRWRVRQPNG
ncbi:hypothetical protein P4E94_00355 [Pontiellaceae bacterium B12219]|nr:hypothetical protein [Pontiellaceae bacterium B12219]